MGLFDLALTASLVDEVDAVVDLEETGYQPSFTRLASTGLKKGDLAVDPETYLIQSLTMTLQKQPQLEGAIQNCGMSPEKVDGLMKRIRANVTGVQR